MRASIKIVRRLIGWGFGLAGALALLLGGMIATPLVRPPELKSISETVGRVDRSTMPALQRFSARDGTELAYRHYPARATPIGKVAILVHGSSGSSVAVHALADGLAARGIDTFAPDIRGHGGSGTRGDIGYLGQLEDDLTDLVAEVRRTAPSQPIVLLGHSAGGGFALRAASAPTQDLFARSVLLSPYLGYDAPTNRENSGGWASPDTPRILALGVLDRVGLRCCEALPALAFAVRPNSEKFVASTYSYRLFRNFATRDYKADLAAAKHPVTVIAGADDELMLADKYAGAVQAVAPGVDVKLIAGVNHMEIVSAPQAVSAIAEDVATR
ncbi:alpha/beta hydrolase [Bradyrhizobium sp. SZCCHNR1051]|uniref:alpha/beta hydrolase n=1 Tax=Bradyrhizobium sp. SZCCHNR1051 TaxID=3057355 RepID=UPI0029168702|nr:alpha/beta hydrolase [Bradyrhizobium sp. SZCCHNR1051]